MHKYGEMGLFVFIVAWEHLMLLIKYIMQSSISKFPESVQNDLKRESYQMTQTRNVSMRIKNERRSGSYPHPTLPSRDVDSGNSATDSESPCHRTTKQTICSMHSDKCSPLVQRQMIYNESDFIRDHDSSARSIHSSLRRRKGVNNSRSRSPAKTNQTTTLGIRATSAKIQSHPTMSPLSPKKRLTFEDLAQGNNNCSPIRVCYVETYGGSAWMSERKSPKDQV